MSIMNNRAIALVDCDSFYVSCEQLLNPDLRGKPVCVMSNNDGCIVARSKEAKALGIKMGSPVFQMRREYPDVHYISGRLDLYGDISGRVMNIIKDFTPLVEIYSIDEAFAEFTGLRKLYRKSYLEMAASLRSEVINKVGVPVSVGVSSSKTLAKLATERAKKTTGYYRIGFRDITDELKQTRLIDVWGFGCNTSALLNNYGINTTYEYTLQNDKWIKKILGKRGIELKYELMGECVYPVTDKVDLPKSIQKTSSFAKFTTDKNYIKNSLSYHTHRACRKLRKLNIKTQLVGVMLRTKDFKVYCGNNALIYPSDWEFEIFNTVNAIFEEIFIPDVIYRSSGVMLGNFSQSSSDQLSLFENIEKRERQNTLAKTWDNLEDKYGRNVLFAGCHVENPDITKVSFETSAEKGNNLS